MAAVEKKPLSRRMRKRVKRTRKWLRFRYKSLRRFLLYLLIWPIARIVGYLPEGAAYRLGRFFGRVICTLARGERGRALQHLNMAFGDSKSPEEKERICREMFISAGYSAVEWCRLRVGRVQTLQDRVSIEGMEHLEPLLSNRQGCVFVTAHFGNWELIPAVTTPKIETPVAVVAREISNPWLEREVVQMRESFGVRVFHRGATGREYVRFLRKGHFLAVLGDMDTNKGEGIFVRYFGHPAWTQVGIARLAWMGRARLAPVFIFRDRQDPRRHHIRVEPPLDLPENLTLDAFLPLLTQSFTRKIEEAVRERPDQWMWFHRRWRRQPTDEEAQALGDLDAMEKVWLE